MSKSLIGILHYNSTQYTDVLYELLKPYEKDIYDLVVLDNGSDPGKESKYASLKLEKNMYYGGGLDAFMNYFIENPQYDSMALLNSDLIVHGYNFIHALRNELFAEEDLVIVSASVIQPAKDQCHWKSNHNWNSKTIRYVPWADYQCVLLKRKFVEHVGGFGSRFGWVQDIMSGIICSDKGWKIGVCDWIPVIHLGNRTVKDHKDSKDPIIVNYNFLADQEMYQYFQQNEELWNKFIDQRKLAEEYKNFLN